MSNKKLNGLVTLLKYLDNDFISDEQYEIVGSLDINTLEQQNKIIRTLLIPGFEEFNKITQESIKKLLEDCLQDPKSSKDLDIIFSSISMPFENDIQDKRAFIENVYKELFGVNMQK
jgi:hypothetical protein